MTIINKQNGKINVFIGSIVVNVAVNSFNSTVTNTYNTTIYGGHAH